MAPSTNAPILLGTQYFRPPFPRERYWRDDLKSMRDAGLNAVQMWLVWGWCEPEPGKFVFDDYNRLADMATAEGLGLVFSTLPEVNPFWIPRVHPDALMRDIEGNVVKCCNRVEVLSGLVPGGCSDHPGIRSRMENFLSTCAAHFGRRDNLLLWDAWNENRWATESPSIVCFCEHSHRSLLAFLRAKYGDLDGLSGAWGRRYCSWDDVRIGRFLGNSHPEMRDFTHWLCQRAQDMIRWRVAALRQGDANHSVISHTAAPSVYGGVTREGSIFQRGVDWDIAEGDGYGYSSFFFSAGDAGCTSGEDVGMRMTAALTAGGGKPCYMSELQGGAIFRPPLAGHPLTGAQQQSWIWTGLARGNKGSIFWCWRNEVFNHEINGYGVVGADGLAADRVAAMRRTSDVLAAHADAIRAFTPDPAQTAILFQRDTYFHDWANQQFHNRCGETAFHAPQRTLAWMRALERLNVAYDVLDDRHLPGGPSALKLAIVPWAAGLDDAAVEWLLRFANSGGVVFVEGAPGEVGADTFYRYPDERPLTRALGLVGDLHRLNLHDIRTIPVGAIGNKDPITILPDEIEASFKPGPHVVPLPPDGMPLLANVPHGAGRVICLGTLIGERMNDKSPKELQQFVACLLTMGGVTRAVRVAGSRNGFCSATLGGKSSRLLILTNHGTEQDVKVSIAADQIPMAEPSEWFGRDCSFQATAKEAALNVPMKAYDYAVFEWRRE